MKIIIASLVLNLIFLNSNCGQTCNDWAGDFFTLDPHPANTACLIWGHNNNNSVPYFSREHWQSTPYRTLQFSSVFLANCNYIINPGNQTDWNKLMYISTVEFPGGATNPDWALDGGIWSLRLGWRWNIALQMMEVGLYSHIRHIWEHLPNPRNGREAVFITTVPLMETFLSELVFSDDGMFAAVNNVGVCIKRNFEMSTLGLLPLSVDQVCTGLKKSAYFGGDECPPHSMNIIVSDIFSDCPSTLWQTTSIKGFARSYFYPGESLSYFADEEIRAPVQVEEPTGGFPDGNGQFVKIHGGANISFSACNRIVLEPGFETMPGATFSAQVTNCRLAGNSAKQTEPNNSQTISEIKLPETNAINQNKDKVFFFPNPCNRNLTGLFPEPFSEGTITIRDISGKLVFSDYISSNFQQFNLPTLSPGSYVAIATPKDHKLNSVFKKITVLQQ